MSFASGVNYGWIEVNAQHAFIRDEMSKVMAAVVVVVVVITILNRDVFPPSSPLYSLPTPAS